MTGGVGYLWNEGQQEQIIDRFFLGGDNLRGFQIGGAGPHDAVTGDPLGGRFIWTQSTELRFPLPVSADLGLSGRAFVDVGGLTQASFQNSNVCVEFERVALRDRRLGRATRRRRRRHFLAHPVRSDKRRLDAVRGKAAIRSDPDFPIRLRYEVLVLQSRLLAASARGGRRICPPRCRRPRRSRTRSGSCRTSRGRRPRRARRHAPRRRQAEQAQGAPPGLVTEGTGAEGQPSAAGAGAAAAAARGAAAAEGPNAAGGHRRRAVGGRRDARLHRLPAGRQGVRRAAAEAERGRAEGAGRRCAISARRWPMSAPSCRPSRSARARRSCRIASPNSRRVFGERNRDHPGGQPVRDGADRPRRGDGDAAGGDQPRHQPRAEPRADPRRDDGVRHDTGGGGRPEQGAGERW